jgi:protein disulfide-isomerase A1
VIQVAYTGELTVTALTAFLNDESMPLFGEIGPDTYKKFVDRKLPLVYFFMDPNNKADEAVAEAGKSIAGEFKGKLSLCSIDGVQYAKHGESLGVQVCYSFQNFFFFFFFFFLYFHF